MEEIYNNLSLNKHQITFVFLLVIVVYLIYNRSKNSSLVNSILYVSVAAMFVFAVKLYYYKDIPSTAIGQPRGEKLIGDPAVGLVDISNTDDFDKDDTNLSAYGNISKDTVDYLGQDSTKDLNFKKISPDTFDNSQLFDNMMNQSSMFTPNEAHSRDYQNVKDRSWYSKFFQQPQNINVEGITIPINERGVNADDSLTRRQIARGDINKNALDGAVRATKNLFNRLYTHELAENYAREWWSGEGEPEDVRGSVEFDYKQF